MDLESNAPLTDERRENWMRCEEEDELNNFSLPFLLNGPTTIYVTGLCGRTRAKPNPPEASRNELLRAGGRFDGFGGLKSAHVQGG